MVRRTLHTDTRFEFTGDGPGRFAGYAVTYNLPLRSGDIVQAGAFDASFDEFVRTGALLSQHDWDKTPVGMFDVARSDDRGVWVEGTFHSTPDAQQSRTVCAERIAAGKLVPMSVGFMLDESTPVNPADRWGACTINRGTLLEVSLVGVGNDPNATLLQTHALRDGATFADHSDSVLAAVQEFIDRVRGISELRSFEGRVLSQTNVDRLLSHADALETASGDIRTLCAGTGKQEHAASLAPLMMSIEGILARCGYAGGN